MTKQEELKQLQARKVALLSIMASSDAHAAKCAKLGKKFQTQYPEDYAAYVAANEEYQTVEKQINSLEFELSVDDDDDNENDDIAATNENDGSVNSPQENEKPTAEETEGE